MEWMLRMFLLGRVIGDDIEFTVVACLNAFVLLEVSI